MIPYGPDHGAGETGHQQTQRIAADSIIWLQDLVAKMSSMLCLAGQLTLTCPDAQGLQPQNLSLDFSLQAWEASRPQAVPVDIVGTVQALPGQFQLSYNITQVSLQ